MTDVGANSVGSDALEERKEDFVLDVYVNNDMSFAIVEMRSVELASNAMALDGLAAALGPTQPSCFLKLEAVNRQAYSSSLLDKETMLGRTLQAQDLEARIQYLNGFETRPSCVLCLLNASVQCVSDCADYNSLSKYFEAEKYGTLKSVYVPRLFAKEEILAFGRVFFEYSDIAGSVKAVNAINKKMLGYVHNNIALYYPEDRYSNGDLSIFAELLL
ncbi:hypothetical protein IFM89_034111 [Coptis chinensis]|uniref:RRM domain-containing protein n=1 Tax=Coptis chinensis TaxID=261450 RepID=A0A835I4U0_9MAGN|nr:hypothetical protein IFM89_034111 [Coptis chinensis]